MGTGAAGSAKQENTHSRTLRHTHTHTDRETHMHNRKSRGWQDKVGAEKAKQEKEISKDGDSPPKLAKCRTW